MQGKPTLRATTWLILAAAGQAWAGEAAKALDEVVVTAPRMAEPLTVTLDPRRPQQPVPANDGASFLKNVPGVSIIRKGGTDGDPVLRGLAGSRLNLLMDGTELLGGCPGRMDPPTAYVFPEAFDRVTVLKGPQSVSHGNGNLAGVVLFERDEDQAARPGARAYASLMGGAWGRLDAAAGGTYAGEKAFLQANLSHAEADDYKDGAGRKVNSEYRRQSLNAKLGWNIDPNTRFTVDAVQSRAEAAYADRAMDGSQFDREGYGIKFTKKNLSPVVQRVEAQAYYNHIDHVMDNYSLRTPPASCMGMMGMTTACAGAMDVDRKTRGARLNADLALGRNDLLTVGADWQANVHAGRMVMNYATGAQATAAYLAKPKLKDLETDITGLFGEWRHEIGGQARVIAGLRFDAWNADRYDNATNPVTWKRGADEHLTSGFLRYEQDLKDSPATLFVGLGHAARPMDYWEMKTYNGLATSIAIPQLKPERNTQLDAGITWQGNDLSAGVSLFYSRIDDYLLTASTALGATCPGALTSCAYNVDATRYGGEADLAWRFAPGWTLRGALAYVRGENDTLDKPLAQTPPLEGRLGLDYATGAWTFGGIVRMAASQDRIHPGYGNIVGQDLSVATDSFATLALNLAYKPSKSLLVSAGIDNVFDRTYAEHLSRRDSEDAGLPANSRVYEPGRFVWVKLNYRYE